MNEKEMALTMIEGYQARIREMCRQHERNMAERDAELARVKSECKELTIDRQALSDGYQKLQRSYVGGYAAVEKQRTNIKAFENAITQFKAAIRETEQRCLSLQKNADNVAQKARVAKDENEAKSAAEIKKLRSKALLMKSKNSSLQSDIARKEKENIQLKKIADDCFEITCSEIPSTEVC